jgi:hypothetical protein
LTDHVVLPLKYKFRPHHPNLIPAPPIRTSPVHFGRPCSDLCLANVRCSRVRLLACLYRGQFRVGCVYIVRTDDICIHGICASPFLFSCFGVPHSISGLDPSKVQLFVMVPTLKSKISPRRPRTAAVQRELSVQVARLTSNWPVCMGSLDGSA